MVRRHSRLEHVIFEILTSDQMQAQLQTGTIQYMYPVIPTQIASVKAIKGVSVGEAEGVSADTLGMNYAAPEYRPAGTSGDDLRGEPGRHLQDGTRRLLYDLRPEHPPDRPGMVLPTTGVNAYNYNPAEAKKLLAEAGSIRTLCSPSSPGQPMRQRMSSRP